MQKAPPKYFRKGRTALVLVELLVVLLIVGLLATMAMISFSPAFGKTHFEKQAQELINVLQMAQNAAAQGDTRYAVILDFDEQTYTLREFAALDLQAIPDEEAILTTVSFSDQCVLDYVLFDDFTDTRSWDIENLEYFRARFYAGHSGWQYGGKIVLRDADGRPWSVIINRFNRIIKLLPGDVEILVPVENLTF